LNANFVSELTEARRTRNGKMLDHCAVRRVMMLSWKVHKVHGSQYQQSLYHLHLLNLYKCLILVPTCEILIEQVELTYLHSFSVEPHEHWQ